MALSDGIDGQSVAIETDADVVRVRQVVRALAAQAGLSLVDQTKLITAASELARNTLIHGKGGTAALEVAREGGRSGVRVVFVDRGPGIPDLSLAFQEGWTSGTGLGLGLPGSRRLVDAFEVETEVGKGTRIAIIKWGRR
jgi:serine/threonine-protein kinase RsbT